MMDFQWVGFISIVTFVFCKLDGVSSHGGYFTQDDEEEAAHIFNTTEAEYSQQSPIFLVDISCHDVTMERNVAELLSKIASSITKGNIRVKLKGQPLVTADGEDSEMFLQLIQEANLGYSNRGLDDVLGYITAVALDTYSTTLYLVTDMPPSSIDSERDTDFLITLLEQQSIQLNVIITDACVDTKSTAHIFNTTEAEYSQQSPIFLVDISCHDVTMERNVAELLSKIASSITKGNIRVKLKVIAPGLVNTIIYRTGQPLVTADGEDSEMFWQLIQEANLGHSNRGLDDVLGYITSVALDTYSTTLYLVTDMPPSSIDSERDTDFLITLLEQQSIQLNFIITDACVDTKSNRPKRATQPSYHTIAQATGGSVLYTSKTNIGSVASILKDTITSSQVTIMKFTFHGSGLLPSLLVPVDDTMTAFTVRLQTKKPAVAIVKRPNDKYEPFAPGSNRTREILSSTTTHSLLQLKVAVKTDFGNWKLMKMDSNEWEVVITGQSEVRFSHEFTEPGPGGFGQYPITGNPIAGKVTKLTVKVPHYDLVQSVDNVLLLDNNGTELDKVALTNVGGRRGKSLFRADVTIPAADFQIAIEGTDKTGHTFRRLDPRFITPVAINLIVSKIGRLYVNEFLNIQYTVTNPGSKEQDVLVKMADNLDFAQLPKMLFETVPAGQNKSGHFTIQAGPTKGVTDIISISAQPYVRNQQTNKQFVNRRITVEERPKKLKDKIKPICTVTRMQGKCDLGADLCGCSNYTWHMEVEVSDDASGVHVIQPIGVGNSSAFHADNFTKGQNVSAGKIKAEISSDCCHNRGAIQVTDKDGNSAECYPTFSKNFTVPDPNVCRNLNKTSKIPCVRSNIVKRCSSNLGWNDCDCDKETWKVISEFGDAGFGISNILTSDAGNATLKKTSQSVIVSADCCHQKIAVVATDVAGNVGRCEAVLSSTFKAPTPTDCLTTTSTSTTTTTTTPVLTTPTTTSTTTSPSTTKPTTNAKTTNQPATNPPSNTILSKRVTATVSSLGLSTINSQSKQVPAKITVQATPQAPEVVKEETSETVTPASVAGLAAGGLAIIIALVTAAAVYRKISKMKKTVQPANNDHRRPPRNVSYSNWT